MISMKKLFIAYILVWGLIIGGVVHVAQQIDWDGAARDTVKWVKSVLSEEPEKREVK